MVINTNKEHPDYQSEQCPGYWVREWKPEIIQYGFGVITMLASMFYVINDKPNAPFPRPGTPKRSMAEAELAA